MKSYRLPTFLILAAALAALASPLTAAEKSAPAAPHASENKPEWADLFGDASLPVVWQSTVAASEKIAVAIASKDMNGIPDWAETIHLAAHALVDQVKLADAEQQKRLKGALGHGAQLADTVMDAANHHETDKAADAYRRMKAALDLAKVRLPKEIIEAPQQQVRYAKAPKHGDHGHAH